MKTESKKLTTHSLTAIICALSFFAFSATSHAQRVPAKNESMTVSQPNGERIEVTMHGNSSYRWLETAKGYVVIRNPSNSTFEFAVKEDKPQGEGFTLVSSGIAVTSSSPSKELLEKISFAKHKDAVAVQIQKFK